MSVDPRTVLAHPPAADATTAAKLRWAVSAAVLAPSKLNTQPWRFEVSADAVDMYADGARGLPASDPTGRELVIGCGAALGNLRLAVRELGHVPIVELLPEAGLDTHLCRVRLGPAHLSNGDEQRRFAALPRRRTDRSALDGSAVSVRLLVAMHELARAEGVEMAIVQSPGRLHGLADLVARADRAQSVDPAYRHELWQWVRQPESRSRDGITAYALGMGAADRSSSFAPRNLDLTGRLPAARTLPVDTPAITVLWSDGDSVTDWLRTGQALSAILLEACAADVAVAFVNQPLEDPALRAAVRDELDIKGVPQLLLRLGRGTRGTPTPRRPADDVMSSTEAPTRRSVGQR